MKLLIILPAFNEVTVIASVIRQLKTVGKNLPVESQICVINDGSTDGTAAICQQEKVMVINHLINCGLGASLATGLEYARKIKADFAITLDSDGQHDPQDIIKLLRPMMRHQADVVIGSRMLTENTKMPRLRQINNHLFNWLTHLLFRVKTSDSLSGFRGFNRLAIQLIRLKTERMEVSNEFFSEIKRHHLRFIEVPVKVIYTDYSLAKGVKPGTVFAIIFRLLLRLVR